MYTYARANECYNLAQDLRSRKVTKVTHIVGICHVPTDELTS